MVLEAFLNIKLVGHEVVWLKILRQDVPFTRIFETLWMSKVLTFLTQRFNVWFPLLKRIDLLMLRLFELQHQLLKHTVWFYHWILVGIDLNDNSLFVVELLNRVINNDRMEAWLQISCVSIHICLPWLKRWEHIDLGNILIHPFEIMQNFVPIWNNICELFFVKNVLVRQKLFDRSFKHLLHKLVIFRMAQWFPKLLSQH